MTITSENGWLVVAHAILTLSFALLWIQLPLAILADFAHWKPIARAADFLGRAVVVGLLCGLLAAAFAELGMELR